MRSRNVVTGVVLAAMLAAATWGASAIAQGGDTPGADDDDGGPGEELLAFEHGPGFGGPGMGIGHGGGFGGPGMGMRHGGGRGMRMHHGRGFGPGPLAHLKELGLSSQQPERIEAIHDAQRRGAIERRKDLELAELDMAKLMRADAPDRRAIAAQIDRIAGLRAELHKARLNTMLDVRDVLTPQQRQKLEQLRERGPGDGADDRPAPRGPNRQGGTRGQ